MHLPILFARQAHAARADDTVVQTLANSRSLTGPVTLTTTVLSNPVPANTVSAPVTRLTRAGSAAVATTTSAGGALPTITVTQTVPVRTSSASTSAAESSPAQTTAVATDPLSSAPAVSSAPPLSSSSAPPAPSSVSSETPATSETSVTAPEATFSGAAPSSVPSAAPLTTSRSPSDLAAANTPAPTPTAVPTGSIGADTSGVKPQGVGAASKSSVPVAAIVVPVVLVLLLALGLLVFFIRRRAVKSRLRRRNTWGAGKYQTPDFCDTERAYEAARRANVAPNVGEEAKAPFPAVVAPRPPPVVPAPPQMSYNNNPPPPLLGSSAYAFPPLVTLAPALASGASTTASPLSTAARGLAPAGPSALVRYTFIPTLPDELHISSGERVRVLTEYDDGWALCENGSGEQGMVPLECLDRSGSSGGLNVPPSPAASYRSKRASSLAAGSGIRPPVGQQNRYF